MTLPPTALEVTESLEQLVLENGYKIKVLESDFQGIGVDTPEDLKLSIDCGEVNNAYCYCRAL